MDERLTWEDSFEIALALKERFPEVNLEEVSLRMIFLWTLQMPGFSDDPDLANDSILSTIFQEWFEEVNPL